MQAPPPVAVPIAYDRPATNLVTSDGSYMQ